MSSTSLLVQLIVILATARSCGWLLRFLGQPGVVGEMAAGLLLGPVVFGALFPTLHAQLFSKESLDGLTSLSTLGLGSCSSLDWTPGTRRCDSADQGRRLLSWSL
jgi:Kef-type K+ transport system membrane component KefB